MASMRLNALIRIAFLALIAKPSFSQTVAAPVPDRPSIKIGIGFVTLGDARQRLWNSTDTQAHEIAILLPSWDSGVFVVDVDSNSAAAAAGIKFGDIITKIGDVPIRKLADVDAFRKTAVVGETYEIVYFRANDKAMAWVKGITKFVGQAPLATTQPAVANATMPSSPPLAAQSATPPPIAQEPAKQLADGVTLSLLPEITTDGRVIVRGRTNLPVGTKLIVSVDESGPAALIGQAKCSVRNGGEYSTDAIGDGRLADGVYSVDVVMPLARVQPTEVRQSMGEQGENLHGPLVHESEMGGKIVEAKTSLTVGGTGAIQTQRQRAVDEVKKYDELTGAVEALHSQLQPARSMDDQKWGQFAQTFKADLKALQAKLELVRQDNDCGMDLNVAAAYLGDILIECHGGTDFDFYEGQYQKQMATVREDIEELKPK